MTLEECMARLAGKKARAGRKKSRRQGRQQEGEGASKAPKEILV